MTIRTKQIDILPDRSLMPKIGQAGYSVSQAISELVDNSIDARREGKVLNVSVQFDPKTNKITVRDDGSGMDEQTAEKSLKLAHSTKKDQLGEFGLGLKTAASSLGKSFSIKTSSVGSEEEYLIDYDEDKWLREGNWTSHPMKIRRGQGNSGTAIEIRKLRIKIYPNLPSNVRNDLSVRFAPYIENGEVRIWVNTKLCEPKPLDLKEDYAPPKGMENFRFKLESGNDVFGWRGLLKKGSDKGEYGFRVFRRGRLIMQFAKIGFHPHPEARQIVGELHLDHIPVTHNKREFIQESPFWQELTKEGGIFWNFMRDIVREARSNIRKTEVSQGVRDKMEVQLENIMKAIKKTPEFKIYAFPDLAEKQRTGPDKAEGRDEVEIEKRDPRDMVSEVEISESKGGSRQPNKLQTKRHFYLTIKGKRFKVSHDFQDFNNDSSMKDVHVDEENGIQVFTNISFPAFKNTTDHVFYGAWHVAEAVAEVMIDINAGSPSEVTKIRDLIMKKSAQITRDLDDIEHEMKEAERLRQEYEAKQSKLQKLRESVI